jgi:hypothetical protein
MQGGKLGSGLNASRLLRTEFIYRGKEKVMERVRKVSKLMRKIWDSKPQVMRIGKQTYELVISQFIGAANLAEYYDEAKYGFGLSPKEVRFAHTIRLDMWENANALLSITDEKTLLAFLKKYPHIKRLHEKHFDKYLLAGQKITLKIFEKMFRLEEFQNHPIFQKILDFYETGDIVNDSRVHIFPQLSAETQHLYEFDMILPCTGDMKEDSGLFVRGFCEIQHMLSNKLQKITSILLNSENASEKIKGKYLASAISHAWQRIFLGGEPEKHHIVRWYSPKADKHFEQYVKFIERHIRRKTFHLENLRKFPADCG